ncbi:MAG: bifunctional phosphopantothenoylcysteine decarboxylase/phosphopantothenate--cysteine ligase CoaBC [Gammaproteobacteria bacterium]|nr:MAG: bifunctional phosphopantothenoylcysteine decarboxylase/phosphopantothenate--cysteine ligase CoaBC [Gammaproteobacteria bacterium]
MKPYTGKNVVLGITGGIAAYKSIELIRRLNDSGINVRVIMTKAATEFVTPMTFEAISGNAVHTEMFGPRIKSAIEHIELARWADLLLIAPATANIIAKVNHGIADDLLSTVSLALTDIDLAIAPAMNLGMWQNPATQKNISDLNSRGINIWGPASGFQACGEIGSGRMIEAAEIVDYVKNYFVNNQQLPLSGKKIVITAGPTREPVDPVRFITNRSSGKMGYALAQALADNGAEVKLISGPVSLSKPAVGDIERITVETAMQMKEAVFDNIDGCDIFVGTAAVADYRIADIADKKLKKSQDDMRIDLIKNPDILGEVAALKKPPFTVGFAAETDNLEKYAKGKLEAKKLNMIAANIVGVSDKGFDSDKNELHVFWKDNSKILQLEEKRVIADKLVHIIMERYDAENKIKNT